MGQETGTHISDLVTTNPVDNTDTVASLGGQVRFIKTLLKANVSVVQVVQATYTTETAITSASLTDTGLTASITPSVSTNKVLVIVSQSYQTSRSTSESFAEIELFRGATLIDNATIGISATGATAVELAGRQNIVFLDSPASASSVTYKTQAKVNTATDSAAITLQPFTVGSSLTLMEITV